MKDFYCNSCKQESDASANSLKYKSKHNADFIVRIFMEVEPKHISEDKHICPDCFLNLMKTAIDEIKEYPIPGAEDIEEQKK